MHTPSPRSQRPCRSSSRPLDVAASLILTVGLLSCAAPAAQAAEAASAPFAKTAASGDTPASAAMQQSSPASSTSASSVADEHPSLKSSVTARFREIAPQSDGQRIFYAVYTIRLTNTGDVPLVVPSGGVPSRQSSTIAVGESKDFEADDTVVEDELVGGAWRFVDKVFAVTPKGVRVDSAIDTLIPVPGYVPAQPSPAPSQPATPSTGAPTPAPSPAPSAAAPAVTVTIAGTFDTKPGELVKEGTRVAFTYDVKNTGGVDLTDVLGRKTLAVGESFRLTTTETVVTAQNLKDGFVAAESKDVRGTLPNGTRIVVSPAFEYKLPIPEKPPIPAEMPDMDVQITGTFEVKEGEPVVAGTKVKWVAAVTNTGNVALRDVQVADSEKLAELPVGQTGVLSFESTVTERDVFNHSIFVATVATATTPTGGAFTENTLGTLGIPAVTPSPVVPVPQPIVTPTTTPAPTSSPAPTPAPTAAAGTRPAADVTLPTAPSSTRSTAGHLASTGSDAAAVLPAAGILALLGAVGVFLGRRRRSRPSTTD